MASFWKQKPNLKIFGPTGMQMFTPSGRARKSASGIHLGQNLLEDGDLYITPKELSTHMHVLGGTGVGKSKFLELTIKELIMRGHGLCLIDPHGDLYHDILDFCSSIHEHPKAKHLNLASRVIPFDVAEEDYVFGFNPMARNKAMLVYQVISAMESIRKSWQMDSFSATPRLARWLFNMNYALIEGDLTLMQARHLASLPNNDYRPGIIGRIQNQDVKAEWEYVSELRNKERQEQLESSLNRLQPFFQNHHLRRIFGRKQNTINFPNVLQNNNIVLVNLAYQGSIREDQQRLIGTMLINELLTAAFARPKGQRNPFFVLIDEFQHFVTKDICEILDGGRKFGIHLVLAHQHLGQLKKDDHEVYYSTLTNARTKVVFGGVNVDDLKVMGEELFLPEFNPNEIKQEIWQTKFRPVESTRIVTASSESSGSGSSFARAGSTVLSCNETFIPGSGWFAAEEKASRGKGSGKTDSSSEGESSSSSSGTTVTETPFYEFHEFQELSSREFRSFQEQMYIKMGQLKRQPARHFTLLVPGQNVQLGEVRMLNTFAPTDSQRRAFLEQCFASADCFASPQAADREAADLDEMLIKESRQIELTTSNTDAVIDITPEKKPARKKSTKAAVGKSRKATSAKITKPTDETQSSIFDLIDPTDDPLSKL